MIENFDWDAHRDQAVEVVFHPRPTWKGQPLKAGCEVLIGHTLLVKVAWQCDEDEKYPNEFALEAADSETHSRLRSVPMTWVASGDVQVERVIGPYTGYIIDYEPKYTGTFVEPTEPFPTGHIDEFKFTSGDFTIEGFFHPTPGLPWGEAVGVKVDVPQDGQWHRVAVVRKEGTTTVHSDEEIDGVRFISRLVYDEDQNLLEKHLVRADQVKG